jgi:cytochrome c-type biogenesis protein CcmH
VTRRAVVALVAVLALLAPSVAVAADCPRTTLGDVEDEVMCPVCGTPLSLATESPQALRERAYIQRQVQACRSKDQIKASLAAQFGDDVLALPGGDGFDLAAYLVPALGLLIGGGALGAAALQWRRTRRSEPPASSAAEPSGAATERLNADMERYDL